jgi:hypothetical protein
MRRGAMLHGQWNDFKMKNVCDNYTLYKYGTSNKPHDTLEKGLASSKFPQSQNVIIHVFIFDNPKNTFIGFNNV